MREALLVLAGFSMGVAWMGALQWRRESKRNQGQQWFRRTKPSEAPGVARPLPGLAQPGPRPIVGQKPSEGRHRPKQRQARFVQRTWRSKG